MISFLVRHSVRISLLLLFLGARDVVTAQQQQHVIAGKVLDEAGNPVDGVTARIKGASGSQMTDAGGTFQLAVVQAGRYELQLSSVGFHSQAQSVLAQSAKNATVQVFVLKRDDRQVETVTVEGRSETRALKESGFAANSIDVRKLANATADLNQVLNRTTGVKVREQGGMGSDFEFSVSGLSGKSVKFFLDGVPLEVMGSAMSLNNIPVNLADRIEVYKGVAPIELGSDALGGAVNIVSNRSLDNYLDVSHSYGSFRSNQSALNAQYVAPRSGLVFKLNGFFNYSKNNYMMRDIEVWDAAQQAYVLRDFPRFNDRYRSYMGRFEVGLVNKSWADALFLSVGYTDFDKQVQTGVRQTIVYGDVSRDGYGKNLSLRYKKDGLLNDRLDVNWFMTYAQDRVVTVDTMLRKYSWDGTYTDGNAETGTFGLATIDRPRFFSRAHANYRIADNQKLGLNYSFDQIENKAYNAYYTTVDEMPGKLGKHIAGLSYQLDLFDRWTNTLMAKYYGVDLKKRQYDYDLPGLVNVSDFQQYFGYGVASVFKLTPRTGIKGSYENTYRLQDVNEVFGDGLQIINNLELKPESSKNANLGMYYGLRSGQHDWFVEVLGSYRDVKDLISPNQYANNMIQYTNVARVLVRGLDAEVKYDYADWLHAMVNVTYLNAVNNTRFVNGSTTESATYKFRVPNQPWLYGNLDLGVSKNNLFMNDSRLHLNWSSQYTREYDRSWGGLSTKNSIEIIPKQLIHNLMLSYQMAQGKYNVSLECRNVTNELVFDNFRLQKPGRAFYLKLRYFLNQKNQSI